MYRSMTTPGVLVARKALAGSVTFPKTAHARRGAHGEASRPLGTLRAGGQRTHCRRAHVALLLILALWVMGCWQQRLLVRVRSTLPAQVVVQQGRACTTGARAR
eukprot:scaffold43348_cov65-Phaeocystis_antarctica.AAC.1